MSARLGSLSALAAVGALALAAGTASADVFPGAGFAIPDNSPAGASSSIVVAGFGGPIGPGVAVGLNFGTGTVAGNREHTWAGDLVATLTYTPTVGAPVSLDIMNRLGKSSSSTVTFGRSDDMNGATYLFLDTGAPLTLAAPPAVGGNIPTGSYRSFTYDGAATNSPTSLDGAYAGLAGNGTWSLNVSDRAGGDTGDLVSWSLTLNAVPEPTSLGVIGLAAMGLVTRRRRH